jgi:hypothetical protein
MGFLPALLGLSLCMPTTAHADFVMPLFEPIMGVPLFFFVTCFEMLIFCFLCKSVVKIDISSSDCCLIVFVANVASFVCGMIIDDGFFRLAIGHKVITKDLIVYNIAFVASVISEYVVYLCFVRRKARVFDMLEIAFVTNCVFYLPATYSIIGRIV